MPVKYAPVDWFVVLADLMHCGFTLKSIASSIDVPVTTVTGWRNANAEPHHQSGEKLIILWCNATLKIRTEIPTKDRPRKPTVFRRSSWIQLHLID